MIAIPNFIKFQCREQSEAKNAKPLFQAQKVFAAGIWALNAIGFDPEPGNRYCCLS